MNILRIYRGKPIRMKVAHGFIPTPFVARCSDKHVRRIYNDWRNADTSALHSRDWIVPMVIFVNKQPVKLTPEEEAQCK